MGEEAGYRQWVTPTPRAVFLLVHGLGAHSGRWEAMSDFFLKKGISSYAIECPDFGSYYSNILRLHDIASKENPSKKIFLVGESLGALISFLFAIDRPGLFDGLVCLAPAFRNKLRLPTSDYLKILASLFYDPEKQFRLPFDPSMLTRDSEYRKKMDSDEREQRSVSSRLMAGTLFSQVRAKALKKRLTTPVLFLVAGDDKIVDSGASVEIFKGLRVEDKTLVEYPGMYHSLSIELGKEKVFEDLSGWIERRIHQ